jgi:hypothetical protein
LRKPKVMRMAGALSGRFGWPNQTHAGLIGRTATLAAVAADAAGDDVLPVLPAALGDRNDVIESQLRRGQSVTAVLARMIVACVDVGARKGDALGGSAHTNPAQQPDDGRQLDGERHGAHLALVVRDDLHLALTPQGDRLLPVHDAQRLVGGVEQERLFHGPEWSHFAGLGKRSQCDQPRRDT